MTNNYTHETAPAYEILVGLGMPEMHSAFGPVLFILRGQPDEGYLGKCPDQAKRDARDLLTMHALRWLRGLLWQANKVVFNISKCADGMMSVNIDTFCEQSGAWDNDGLGEGVDELDAIVEAALAMKEAKADG